MPPSPDWIATPHIPADNRGPIDRPFAPFVDPHHAGPICAMLSDVAAARPARIVIEDAAGAHRFAALLRAAAGLSRRIVAAQPEPGAIGILVPPSAGYASAVFAALAAGRPSLLLDATFPEERNAALAAIGGVNLVLHDEAADPPDWPGVAALPVGPPPEDDGSHPSALADGLNLDAAAFILPTSGSEGRPKLIVHSQRTMLNWLRVTHDAIHLTPDDRVLSLSSFSTLGGFVALLTFPMAGASLQMFDVRSSGLGGLLTTLAERPVTVLRGTPSLMRGLARIPDVRPALAKLRVVQLYGEPCLKADLLELTAVLPATCRLRTTYGSTEASGLSWFAGPPDDYDSHRVANGALMPDTMARIDDDDGHPCAPGQSGELIIKSRYNALGEWVDGRLVPGRLEPDPDDPGVRIFRTGDIARFHPDGIFVVLGRKDRMVKVNGQRIEPAEIESVLRRNTMVRRAEVLAIERAGATRLTAFVVAAPAAPADLVALLKAELRAALPAFMVPSRILVVRSVPLLPTGKVDAAALRAIAQAAPAGASP